MVSGPAGIARAVVRDGGPGSGVHRPRAAISTAARRPLAPVEHGEGTAGAHRSREDRRPRGQGERGRCRPWRTACLPECHQRSVPGPARRDERRRGRPGHGEAEHVSGRSAQRPAEREPARLPRSGGPREDADPAAAAVGGDQRRPGGQDRHGVECRDAAAGGHPSEAGSRDQRRPGREARRRGQRPGAPAGHGDGSARWGSLVGEGVREGGQARGKEDRAPGGAPVSALRQRREAEQPARQDSHQDRATGGPRREAPVVRHPRWCDQRPVGGSRRRVEELPEGVVLVGQVAPSGGSPTNRWTSRRRSPGEGGPPPRPPGPGTRRRAIRTAARRRPSAIEARAGVDATFPGSGTSRIEDLIDPAQEKRGER